MITEVPGVRVGHWTDTAAGTGCTVVLFPDGTVASGEVRGGAPATRELALLAPERLVDRIDAVVLSGRSAFGLATGDGVVRWCEERGIGFPTAAGVVPIVVGLSIFDLLSGDPSIRPGAEEGYAACQAAADGPFQTGAVGVATGATVDKWQDRDRARPGGVGTETVRHGDVVVSALAVANSFGDVLSGPPDDALAAEPPVPRSPGDDEAYANTTLAVVATNATLDKTGCFLLAQSGHDGMARAVRPAHTRFDGDAVIAAAVGAVTAELPLLQELSAVAVERSIRAAVTPRPAG